MQQFDRIPGVASTDVARHLRKKLPAFGNFLHAMHHPHQLAVVKQRGVGGAPYPGQEFVGTGGGVANVVALHPHLVGVAAAHRGLQGRRKLRRAVGLRVLGIVRKCVEQILPEQLAVFP
ncbi:hypothetical protein [Mycobacterium sp.]|jgi:hypothetical protein|uniref:hypothetical protein n=1 Tax=Mycobacterium sp. TaxID=1785 RepID=UPI00260B3765|nr:hypothetical protein [Mycobacterium sp.]